MCPYYRRYPGSYGTCTAKKAETAAADRHRAATESDGYLTHREVQDYNCTGSCNSCPYK